MASERKKFQITTDGAGIHSPSNKTILEFSGYDEANTAVCVYYVNQAHTFDASKAGSADTSKSLYVNSEAIVGAKPSQESSTGDAAASTKEAPKAEETAGSANGYEGIYNEYAKKIRDAAPTLVEEYKEEAAKNSSGLDGLATICNEKIEVLAEISNEGVEKMAEYMMTKGSGKYDEYSEWSGKLMQVYIGLSCGLFLCSEPRKFGEIFCRNLGDY